MAEKDTGEPDESSLELPSLFGRKKKGKRATEHAEPATSDAAHPHPAGTTAEDTAVIAPVTPSVDQPAARAAEPVNDEQTQQLQQLPPQPEHRASEPVAPEPAVPAEQAPAAGGGRRVRGREPGRTEKAPRRELPPVRASLAALVVGAVVGLLGAGLVFGALQTCEAITGTDSCGGPGLLVVLLVVVVMVMAGTALLRALGVTEPGGLSFLGVAIFVAICLVFLLQQLLEPWMVVVGPLLCALSYGTAHWVVNRFNTELLADEGPEPHDVR